MRFLHYSSYEFCFTAHYYYYLFSTSCFRQVEPYIVLLKKTTSDWQYIYLSVVIVSCALWHSMAEQQCVCSAQSSCFIQKKPESSLSTFTFSKSPQTVSRQWLAMAIWPRYCRRRRRLMCTICSILQGEAIHTIQFCLPVSCDFCCSTLLRTVLSVCLSVFFFKFSFVYLTT